MRHVGHPALNEERPPCGDDRAIQALLQGQDELLLESGREQQVPPVQGGVQHRHGQKDGQYRNERGREANRPKTRPVHAAMPLVAPSPTTRPMVPSSGTEQDEARPFRERQGESDAERGNEPPAREPPERGCEPERADVRAAAPVRRRSGECEIGFSGHA